MKIYSLFKYVKVFCTFKRTIIQPEFISKQQFDSYTLIKSPSYEFLMKDKNNYNCIYQHNIDTPASVLLKQGIHILPQNIPQKNIHEKNQALIHKLQQQYKKSYRKCINSIEIFHLERRIKSQIRYKLNNIGIIKGKYRHHLLFKSLQQNKKQKTIIQYSKKGVTIEALGETIYPSGQVWLPTNQRYLTDFLKIVTNSAKNKINSVLDIGCGCGILSFLMKKVHKKAKIVGLDCNLDAIRTYNITAERFNYHNVLAYQFDMKKQKQFETLIAMHKLPLKYDWIIINPPWLPANLLNNESKIMRGVYDPDSEMLIKSISLSSRLLRNKQSRVCLIYSDLSDHIGLKHPSIEKLCLQNNLLIHQIYSIPFRFDLGKKSALNSFKNISNILTYQLGLS